jgi:hypothetical protein
MSKPVFTVVGDAELSDAAIEALARLLLDEVERKCADDHSRPADAAVVITTDPRENPS